MLITATQLKTNIGRYLDTANSEDIYITRKGKIVAKITKPTDDKAALLDSLVGIAAGVDMALEEIREERILRK